MAMIFFGSQIVFEMQISLSSGMYLKAIDNFRPQVAGRSSDLIAKTRRLSRSQWEG
jgi:hypothetical protein